MKHFFVIVILCGLMFPGMFQTGLTASEWVYSASNLKHEFFPVKNEYSWNGRVVHTEQNYENAYSIKMIYRKLPDTLYVEISNNNLISGKTYSGKFQAKCFEDPVLSPSASCVNVTKLEGSFSALPSELYQSHDICALGRLFLPQQVRTDLLAEYDAINKGPYTLPPMPVSPKENSSQTSPVTFEMFLPFRFVRPCREWKFHMLLERYDPDGGGYKWKTVNSGAPATGYEGDNFETRGKKELKLTPDRYRFKLQAEHFEYGKTPWSLPFEFSVKLNVQPGMTMLEKGIRITYPNGGEVLHVRAEPYTIEWNNVFLPREVKAGDVRIILRRNGSLIKVLKKSTPCRIGKARIKITRDLPQGGGYKVLVRSKVDSQYYDVSDGTFSIMNLASSSKRVIKH